MSSIRPVKITDQIASAVRQQVMTCQLRPGERLVEKRLCEDLGVSRASLREALTRLAHENIIDQIPNKGYRVPELTIDRFRMVCETRRVIEADIASLAAIRATAEQIERLRELAPFSPVMNGSSLDPSELMSSNHGFHAQLARMAGNEMLERIALNALDQDNQPYFYGIELQSCTTPEDITKEHLEIVAAIEKGDGERARELMWAHLLSKEHRIMRAWELAALPGE